MRRTVTLYGEPTSNPETKYSPDGRVCTVIAAPVDLLTTCTCAASTGSLVVESVTVPVMAAVVVPSAAMRDGIATAAASATMAKVRSQRIVFMRGPLPG